MLRRRIIVQLHSMEHSLRGCRPETFGQDEEAYYEFFLIKAQQMAASEQISEPGDRLQKKVESDRFLKNN
ncbi:hypothetical protein KIN20_010074 [Parelaphostrongylus tenuis]|uniref:Uncharacterized protein n=1 Tax=Parelaphostrongylus tenuis TaxID=148309 RepID=A0AAD5M7C2_PARTN|nr:hypothetical protein KIN20_010074 [Parelaphostrongylus tenuis]